MSKKKKTSVAEKLQQNLAKKGKQLTVEQVKEALAENAAVKKARRERKGQQLKDYIKFRVDREKKMAQTGADLVKGFKNPGNWVEAGKNILEGEVENVKKLKDLINHPSFYEHYDDLLDEMITPNFGRISGAVDSDIPLANSGAGQYDFPFVTGTDSIPAVAAINLKLVRSSDARQFRMGIDRLYQTIQNINNGNPIGTLEDLAAYVLNFRAVIAGLEQGRRAYGALKKFRLLDESVPMAYFAAFGLDYQTFRNNGANLRNALNNFISEINNKAVFKLDLFDRTISLFRMTYADNPTAKHSEYVFRPFTVEYVGGDNKIKEMSLCNDALGANNTGLDYDSYIAYMQTLVDTMYNNPIFKNLRANIIKAEGLNIFQIERIDEAYVLPTTYNEYMLTQIQNATLIGEAVTYTSDLVGKSYHELITDDEKLVSAAYRVAENYLNKIFINIAKDSVKNSEFISNTRLCVLGYRSADNTQCVSIFGTEVPCEVVVPEVVLNAEAENKQYNIKYFRLHLFLKWYYDNQNSDEQPRYDSARWPFLWAVFDWMPMIGISYGAFDTDLAEWIVVNRTIMWDFANYAVLDTNKQSLSFYHKVAVMNLLFSPLRYQQKDTAVIPAK